MKTLLLVNGLGLLTASVHILGLMVAGRIWGLRLSEIRFLPGPTVFSFKRGDLTWSLGAIPIPGASVKWIGGDVEFDLLPRLTRACIILMGPLFTFVLAAALLGIDRGWGSFRSGFHQLFRLLLFPLSEGQVLLDGVARIAQAEPLVILLGIIAAKSTALNLMPIPALNGGQALFGMFYGGPSKSSWLSTLQTAGALLALLAFGSFLVAEVAFAVRR